MSLCLPFTIDVRGVRVPVYVVLFYWNGGEREGGGEGAEGWIYVLCQAIYLCIWLHERDRQYALYARMYITVRYLV